MRFMASLLQMNPALTIERGILAFLCRVYISYINNLEDKSAIIYDMRNAYQTSRDDVR